MEELRIQAASCTFYFTNFFPVKDLENLKEHISQCRYCSRQVPNDYRAYQKDQGELVSYEEYINKLYIRGKGQREINEAIAVDLGNTLLDGKKVSAILSMVHAISFAVVFLKDSNKPGLKEELFNYVIEHMDEVREIVGEQGFNFLMVGSYNKAAYKALVAGFEYMLFGENKAPS